MPVDLDDHPSDILLSSFPSSFFFLIPSAFVPYALLYPIPIFTSHHIISRPTSHTYQRLHMRSYLCFYPWNPLYFTLHLISSVFFFLSWVHYVGVHHYPPMAFLFDLGLFGKQFCMKKLFVHISSFDFVFGVYGATHPACFGLRC